MKRFYSTEKKPEEPNLKKDISTEKIEKNENEKSEKPENEKSENAEKTEKTENAEKTEKTENAEKTDKTEKEGEQKEKTQSSENTENAEKKTEGTEGQKEEEELPPWWGSLSLTKKLVYSSLFISFISLITKLFYESALRSSLPYKKAFHVIRGVDEIEQAMGDIIEPRWFRVWEALFGYTWEESGGYEGIAKMWIPIVGVTEHPTGELDKNGVEKVTKSYTRGRAYAEAKKVGAGQIEWELVYLIVKYPTLGDNNSHNSSEWLDLNREGPAPVTTKGEMVLVDKRVQRGAEAF